MSPATDTPPGAWDELTGYFAQGGGDIPAPVRPLDLSGIFETVAGPDSGWGHTVSEETFRPVTASREGRVGSQTATGLVLAPETQGCALPSVRALHRIVEIKYQGAMIQVPVLDVGPWFEHDDGYVFGGDRPTAEIGGWPVGETNRGTKRPARNVAGIDLFDGTCAALGVDPAAWGLRRVEWRFV